MIDRLKLASYGIKADEAQSLTLYKGKGCPACNRIGYRRRKGIFEVMPVDSELQEILSGKPTVKDIEKAARAAGMDTLREKCLKDISDGVTTIDELQRWKL